MNVRFPIWLHSSKKYISIGVFSIGFILASEFVWKLYVKHRKKTQQINHAVEPISEVRFFSEESANCRNHANSNIPCRLSTCPTAHLNKIINYIGTATKSLDVCVYFLTCNSIVKAITDVQKKNIFVRVITDDESSGNEASQVLNMRKAGIRVKSKRSIYLMHHKFVIIDKKLLITGSANWTMQAFYGNSENITITNDNDIVSQFVVEYDRLWLKFNSEVNSNLPNVDYVKHQEKTLHVSQANQPIREVLFFSEESAICRNHANSNIPCILSTCPTVHLNKIVQYIGTATESLDVCVYFLTCNSIVNAIIDLQKKNVFVRVITDDESSGNEASQVSNMRKADKKVLITGSANWTMQAFFGNAENIIISDDNNIVSKFVIEYDRLWLKFNGEVNTDLPDVANKQITHFRNRIYNPRIKPLNRIRV